MEIVIESPTFCGQEGENVFFNCIYALPNFEKFQGKGLNLYISFSSEITNEAIEQLLVICKRWQIDIPSLANLRSASNESSALWDI